MMLLQKAAERGYGDERYECLEFQRCYQILRESSLKMVDACQRIEDVQKQPQEIVLDHVLACQKAIFVAERVADERAVNHHLVQMVLWLVMKFILIVQYSVLRSILNQKSWLNGSFSAL
ncbi:hypothetical protein Q3G72_032495 [Acer saccharum]|nr:hypothetical protein Q3G72_032495 [Acer saccharum]